MLLQERLIDYKMLSNACAFYSAYGYAQTEVPWVVGVDESKSTFVGNPDDDISFKLSNSEVLVCSAEQGFVARMHDLALTPKTKYFSVSPCFRDERLDHTHSKWFIKLELFAYFSQEDDGIAEEYKLAFENDAMRFFGVCGFNRTTGAKLIKKYTDIGTDIYAETPTRDGFSLELGSYGLRGIGDKVIVYGTGLALPRMSLAIDESEARSIGGVEL